MKKKLEITLSDFAKLHRQIKKFEEKNGPIQIGNQKLEHFLLTRTSFADHGLTPEIRTKEIILQVAGNYDIKPEDLKDNVNLKDNLLYNDDSYSILEMRLNILIKGYKKDAVIDDDEMTGCDNVGDCVKLVDDKIK